MKITIRNKMLLCVFLPISILGSNVTNMQETSSVITDVSARFREVEQSAANLRGTADILEKNIRNFEI